MSAPLTPRPDPAAAADRSTIDGLRKSLDAHLAQKQALEEQIRRFVRRQVQALSDLIVVLLNLQIQQAEEAVEDDPSLQNRQTVERLRAMLSGYQRSQRADPITPSRADLDESEQQSLKQCFRRALRMCHPDIVPPSRRKHAAEICRALTVAYKNGDLLVVQDILYQLEAKGPIPDRPTDLLKRQIDVLERRLAQVKRQLTELRASEAYQTICQIKDWDAYFEAAQAQLRAQIHDLDPTFEDANPT
ncbi:MAG: hypothetical protein AAFV53_07850 [Myxococcota bacterium]